MGPPAGRQTRWGKAGAPQRGGLPNGAPGGSADPVGKGGRAAAGRAARNEMEGQHDLSGGCARRNGKIARKGQSAGYANCACTNRKTSSGFSATAVQASPSMLPGSAKPKP